MSDFRTDAQITNSISGLQVIRNAADDFSLKAIAGDGSKNVTLIRLKGSSAEADLRVMHRLFVSIFEVLGVHA